MTKLLFFLLTLSCNAFALTPLNAENVLGKYDMQGIVHLKANILANNQIKATQIGILLVNNSKPCCHNSS